jgi:hypothetical protein
MTLPTLGTVALAVNWWGGIEERCSDRGWSACGWTWQLSGYLVLACVAGLLGVGGQAL